MSDEETAIHLVFGVEVRVVAIDISSPGSPIDVLVSSDDNYLSHGGGVSAALWNAAGPDLERWANDHLDDDLALGDVAVSPAGNLPASHILHAVTIDFDTNEALDYTTAVVLYGRVFDTAADLAARTMTMPLLGTGAAGLDPRQSVAALRSALRARRFDPPTILSITVATNPRYPETFSVVRRWLTSHTDTTPSVLELLEKEDPLSEAQAERLRASWTAALAASDPTAAERVFDVVVSVLSATLHQSDGGNLSQSDDRDQLSEADLERLESSDAAAAYRSGVLARNRLLYQRSGRTTRNLRRTLLRSAEELTLLLMNRRTQSTEALEKVVGAELDPIHGLHQLLLTRTSKADRVALLADLRSRGYKGSDSDCLLEYCLRLSPQDLLMDNFTVQQLRLYLNQRGLRVSNEYDISTLAVAVLHDLGFRLETIPPSPSAILEDVTSALAALDGQSEAEMRGGVNKIAVELEECVFQFLRFMARTVLGIDADMWCQRHGVLKLGETLRKASLGTLISNLDRLAVDVAALGDAAPTWVSDGLTFKFPHGYTDLVKYRNDFAHALDPSKAVMPQTLSARTFFRLARDLLKDLLYEVDGEQLYPRIIKVTEIRTDAWGRRLVRAIDDRNADEMIFTSQHVDAGRVYLMRPLSNPLRVEPILMPVGDHGSDNDSPDDR